MSDTVQTEPRPPAIFVLGPTASGKTQLALSLAQHVPCEIISVDSALVYRGMDIGTAKPSADIRAQVPHHLIDLIDPADAYSAARFCEDALNAMQAVTARGRIPLLVGGTMLYFKALEYGLDEMPPADPDIRQKLEAQAQAQGWEALHQRLQQIDPIAAQRIHPNDPQRLQRALEVYELTGRPLSSLQQGDKVSRLAYRTLRLALLPPCRERLRAAIASRFRQMLNEGFVDEVRALRQRPDLHKNLPAMRAVGYRQAWEYLDGDIDADTFESTAITATRQLAKRQLTWLRSYPGITPLSDANEALAVLRPWLEQRG
ncbi:tRNA (adenosine(37)-N6)-dimethylallyltransferase MiaA [Thiorhodospira sibirica]|uniref:tRNA (adenosine(37)-N6)-dimethylallyltransferase MiaA n=1 Tax=Thiorhodospira sibirica TaxID=154347 RepID=UPI00022C1D64|nr:tRNA (adenosine(37)-N6)-dimethylallyltransferase MiaA [Thiorhodospira sibirica]